MIRAQESATSAAKRATAALEGRLEQRDAELAALRRALHERSEEVEAASAVRDAAVLTDDEVRC
jgi:hypothetical protein